MLKKVPNDNPATRLKYVPGASEFTGQSNGLPIALPGPGELVGNGEGPRAASPDPGRAVGNPIDCPVNSEAPGTGFNTSKQ